MNIKIVVLIVVSFVSIADPSCFLHPNLCHQFSKYSFLNLNQFFFLFGRAEMGRQGISRKGCWTEEEDLILKDYVQKYGEGNWRHVSKATELKRCRKSCRLRWLNYLRPNINRDDFSGGEDDLILRLHKLLGNRWSLIAGRLPGRTANDVKNHWICSLSKMNRDGSTTGRCRVSIRKKKKRPENVGKIVKAGAKAVDETEQSERSRCLVSAGVKHPNEKGFEGEGDMISFWKGLLLKGEYIDFHNTTDLDEKLEVS